MKGYTFRRQRPVMNFIADFCCLPLKLVIELDGITHHDAEIEIKDRLKEETLTKNGFAVMRFTDTEVLNELFYEVHPRRFAPPTPAGDIISSVAKQHRNSAGTRKCITAFVSPAGGGGMSAANAGGGLFKLSLITFERVNDNRFRISG